MSFFYSKKEKKKFPSSFTFLENPMNQILGVGFGPMFQIQTPLMNP